MRLLDDDKSYNQVANKNNANESKLSSQMLLSRKNSVSKNSESNLISVNNTNLDEENLLPINQTTQFKSLNFNTGNNLNNLNNLKMKNSLSKNLKESVVNRGNGEIISKENKGNTPEEDPSDSHEENNVTNLNRRVQIFGKNEWEDYRKIEKREKIVKLKFIISF